MGHIPVLFKEALEGLNLHPNMTVVDGTFGGGGHSKAIAEAIGKEGTLIAIDADSKAFERVDVSTFPTKVIPVVSNFRHLGSILDAQGVRAIDGALLDLGISSDSLEASGKGFSFQRDEPLMMTYANDPLVTAEHVVNDWSEETLADIIYGFGEERASRKVARAIVEARKRERITSTGVLVRVIETVLKRGPKGRHPATKIFQAIRMAVNDELGAVTEIIPVAFERLHDHGRLAVITFHSIEDRLVKRMFKSLAEERKGKIITKKPIVPTEEEVSSNPRARSAKLRIIEKLFPS